MSPLPMATGLQEPASQTIKACRCCCFCCCGAALGCKPLVLLLRLCLVVSWQLRKRNDNTHERWRLLCFLVDAPGWVCLCTLGYTRRGVHPFTTHTHKHDYLLATYCVLRIACTSLSCVHTHKTHTHRLVICHTLPHSPLVCPLHGSSDAWVLRSSLRLGCHVLDEVSQAVAVAPLCVVRVVYGVRRVACSVCAEG